MQRMADVVAGWFIIGVVAIALLAFFGWGLFGPQPSWAYGLINAVMVLIIAWRLGLREEREVPPNLARNTPAITAP